MHTKQPTEHTPFRQIYIQTSNVLCGQQFATHFNIIRLFVVEYCKYLLDIATLINNNSWLKSKYGNLSAWILPIHWNSDFSSIYSGNDAIKLLLDRQPFYVRKCILCPNIQMNAWMTQCHERSKRRKSVRSIFNSYHYYSTLFNCLILLLNFILIAICVCSLLKY